MDEMVIEVEDALDLIIKLMNPKLEDQNPDYRHGCMDACSKIKGYKGNDIKSFLGRELKKKWGNDDFNRGYTYICKILYNSFL